NLGREKRGCSVRELGVVGATLDAAIDPQIGECDVVRAIFDLELARPKRLMALVTIWIRDRDAVGRLVRGQRNQVDVVDVVVAIVSDDRLPREVSLAFTNDPSANDERQLRRKSPLHL